MPSRGRRGSDFLLNCALDDLTMCNLTDSHHSQGTRDQRHANESRIAAQPRLPVASAVLP
jgi:hypothetical protein